MPFLQDFPGSVQTLDKYSEVTEKRQNLTTM